VPERDVDALAERLEYLVNHPEVWDEMGRAGRTLVEERYDIRRLNDRLVEVYRETGSAFRGSNRREAS
jgi:colanic acid/amylovoran biosynthesis glycosyltransferase